MADSTKVTSANSSDVKLDWSRLLGFDQAAQSGDEVGATRLNDPRLVKVGAKFGNKGAGKRNIVDFARRGELAGTNSVAPAGHSARWLLT